MDRISTGNASLFHACFRSWGAENRAVLSDFGTILGPSQAGGLLGKSHFRGACKSFIMRGLQFVSYKMYYVNKSCRIEYGGKGV